MQQTLLHITDCHLLPKGELLLNTDTSASLGQVMQQALSEMSPSAIIATGDLVHAGGVQVYRQFLSIMIHHVNNNLDEFVLGQYILV